MLKVLLIEIKDSKSLVNLVVKTANNEWSVLYSHVYEHRFLGIDLSTPYDQINFDNSWVIKMKQDISKDFVFEKINKIYLAINTSANIIITERIKVENLDQIKKAYLDKIKQLKVDYPYSLLLTHNLERIQKTIVQKSFLISYELVNKYLLKKISDLFEKCNMKITEFVSVRKAIFKSLNNYFSDYNQILNIHVEEGFSAMHLISNGDFVKSINVVEGLRTIYHKIAQYINSDLETARYLFLNYGSLPPKKVVDNRIIYTFVNREGIRKNFFKKELSIIITELIDKSLRKVFFFFEELALSETYTVIFSGEISKLNGFEEYARIFLKNCEINNFKNNIIGLALRSEIVSSGIFDYLNDLVFDLEDLKVNNLYSFTKVNTKKGTMRLSFKKIWKNYDPILNKS